MISIFMVCQDLASATNGFHANNRLGAGGVGAAGCLKFLHMVK